MKRSLALWREVLPRALVRELSGAGHLPLEEATAEVAEVIFGTAAVAASARAAGEGK